jgi:hypothetical protein
MSQNDLVIANQSFPATRADINSALQSLGSSNSGTTEPSTTYANMFWYDTANNILKFRSEANDAWINIGYLDQSSNTFKPYGDVPLTLGTAGQVLTVNSGATTGEWADAGGGVTVISKTVISTSVASVDLTGFVPADYTSYEIELINVVPVNDSVVASLRTSSDGGSTYDSGASDYQYTTTTGSAIILLNVILGSDAGEDGISGVVRISGPDLAKKTIMTYQFGGFSASGSLSGVSSYAARLSSAEVDGVQFYFSAGNIESGTIVFRGVK